LGEKDRVFFPRDIRKVRDSIVIIAILLVASVAVMMQAKSVFAATWDPTLGWDFECHSNTHPSFTGLTQAQMRSELEQVNAAFQAHGYSPPQHFAYPYGDYSPTVESVLAQYRKTARMVWGNMMTYPVTNWYEVMAAQLVRTTTWSQITGWIDSCVAKKALLNIFTHDVSSNPSEYGCTPAMLTQLLDYLVQKQNAGQLTVMTMAQAYDYWSTATAGKATVVVSFDDAHESDHTVVYPLFEARGLKGTSYIVTSYIDQPDQLTWDEIAKMRTAPSAHIYIEHMYRGDLVVDVGVGNTASPLWSKQVWNRQGGSADNLDLTVDLSTATAYLPPSNTYKWFLKVYDAAAGDQGRITQFTVTYKGKAYSSTDVLVPISDFKTSYAYIPSQTASAPAAKVYIEHTWVGDLNITIGCGDPSNPLWSKLVWNRTGGSQKNLTLTVNLSAAVAYLPPTNTYRWYLKVYDAAAGDMGRVVTFNITYQDKTYSSTEVPVPISDFKTSYAYIPSSAQAHVYIQHTYRGDLIVDIGVGNTSTPLWSKRVWNGTGGNATNLDLYVDLSGQTLYLPPSATYSWWVKVYDRAAGDQGQILTFTITYQGKTYTSPNVPVQITDFKTSYAYIKG
jgi:subtilisin-like proprotein convertase family protein